MILFGLMLQALTLATAQAESNTQTPTVLAPDFAAQSLVDGQEQRLSDYKGQVVLLNFWASWCFPCRYEMPMFQKMYDRYRHRGFTVVAVAVYDELSNAKAFMQRYNFSFPMLFDQSEDAKRAFGVQVVPQTYLVGRDGRLVPIVDPTTKRSSLSVNDPTLWENPDMMSFIEELIGELTPRINTVLPLNDRHPTI